MSFSAYSPDMGPLRGIRIWLSGAVPEDSECTPEERESITKFVSTFSETVFRLGGHIVHGSHPTLTPILLANAKSYVERGGKRDCLTLVVSRHWSKNSSSVPLAEWRRICTVYETPEGKGEDPRGSSLKILREWMGARCDAFVAVGGKWWTGVAGRAGLPIECGIAVDRGLACFLLGGFGGVARDYIQKNGDLFRALKNGFDIEENKRLAGQSDIAQTSGKICDQLARLPIIRGRASDGSSFRILALDGGGIKGTFTAAALATWENHFKTRIVDHFDLIAGTSTGGIIAIGLGMGLSASELLTFYKKRGPTIFPMMSLTSRIWHTIRHTWNPKFSQAVLLKELGNALYRSGQELTLADSKCRLAIPAYSALNGVSHVFRTPHHPLLMADAGKRAAHVALATSAAPTYFSAATVGDLISETSYFDGGVWANSPAMAAVIEAVCYLKVPLDRVDILSVGTTEEPFSVKSKEDSGWLGWNKKLIDLLMSAQEESSVKHAKTLAGEPQFLRVNAVTPNKAYSLDDARKISELAALGAAEASKIEIMGQIESRFLNGISVQPWK